MDCYSEQIEYELTLPAEQEPEHAASTGLDTMARDRGWQETGPHPVTDRRAFIGHQDEEEQEVEEEKLNAPSATKNEI